MKFFKNASIIFIILCFIFNISLADNSDCWKFWEQSYLTGGYKIVNSSRETDTNEYSNFLSIDQQKAIITKDDLNTALLNLEKYCCNKKLWGSKPDASPCKEDKNEFNDNSLASPYLFDHLFDVIMRRLNWLTWENDIYNTMRKNNNTWVDNKGMERRQRINNEAESTTWSNPQKIIDKYKEFRYPSPIKLGYNINQNIHNVFLVKDRNDFLSYINNWDIAKALQNYENRTLYDRYSNACAMSEYFYALLSTNYSDDVKTIRKSNKCNKITAWQISSETEYTSLIIKRSSNLFLSNYIKGYMSYIEKRTNNLRSIRKNSNDRFLDVTRWVPKLTPECTNG